MVTQTVPSRAKRLSSYQGDTPGPWYLHMAPGSQNSTGCPADPGVGDQLVGFLYTALRRIDGCRTIAAVFSHTDVAA
jgi:hypothetical protein